MNTISLPGIRGESLLGFLSGLGVLRVLAEKWPETKLSWTPRGGGWMAMLQVPSEVGVDALEVASQVSNLLALSKKKHPILNWEIFLEKEFSHKTEFYGTSIDQWLRHSSAEEFTSVFSSQIPVQQGDVLEHFDHPFRAARKDYFVDNLKSIINNTNLEHLVRTIAKPWDYADAMANQSLRLDHGDDRRHAYQWHAPTSDPARSKTGCMLGANRLAIEAFPFFPCFPLRDGGSAVGFEFRSKTYAWITWPVWKPLCSLSVIKSLLNFSGLSEPTAEALDPMGIVAVYKSRRLPVEKNKVFLPPESICSGCSTPP